jgi:NTE family protein
MGDIALVLGGGGSAGHAWTIGVIAGLAEAGIDMTKVADLVIGTSSGANAAAQVRSGRPPADLFTAIVSESGGAVGQKGRSDAMSVLDPNLERMRAISATATSVSELQRLMGTFGLESDPMFEPEVGERRRSLVVARLPRAEWPDRPMIIVAVNAHTGELVTFNKDSGVELVDAAIAATALPGVGPTHSINGSRYISGGVRSADNADLASGYANVVVISPLGGRTGALPEGQFQGLHRPAGADLASEVEVLRKQGSHVEVITPDLDSRGAMGINQMDLTTRIPSARAGFAQGKTEAARVKYLKL